MSEFNVVMSTAESTVVTEYEPQQTRSDAYQSEAALENAFIKMLTEQGYQYLKIDSPSALIDNLRHQLEKLNNYSFSDREWKQFFENKIANSNEGIVEKTRKIQEDHIQVLRRDDGSSKNIYLIDKANIHNNSLQVINQYVEEGGAHDTRYDVTILVNGLKGEAFRLRKRLTKSKDTKGTAFGQAADCMSMFRCLLSLTVRIQNITLTLPVTLISKSKTANAQRVKRQATALSLLRFGQTATTEL